MGLLATVFDFATSPRTHRDLFPAGLGPMALRGCRGQAQGAGKMETLVMFGRVPFALCKPLYTVT